MVPVTAGLVKALLNEVLVRERGLANKRHAVSKANLLSSWKIALL